MNYFFRLRAAFFAASDRCSGVMAAQREATALRALSDRSAFDIEAARALPPRRPSETAAGFFLILIGLASAVTGFAVASGWPIFGIAVFPASLASAAITCSAIFHFNLPPDPLRGFVLPDSSAGENFGFVDRNSVAIHRSEVSRSLFGVTEDLHEEASVFTDANCPVFLGLPLGHCGSDLSEHLKRCVCHFVSPFA